MRLLRLHLARKAALGVSIVEKEAAAASLTAEIAISASPLRAMRVGEATLLGGS